MVWGDIVGAAVVVVVAYMWYRNFFHVTRLGDRPKKELIAVGATQFTWVRSKVKAEVQWFFYKTGDARTVEFGGVGDATKYAHELWETEIRMWVECNHLPKWADPVAARIIADSTV